MLYTHNKLPFISIVSICWNSSRDILALIASIKQSNYPKSKYEVIVVDNGSQDNSVAKIKKAYPKTKVIALGRNIGIPARNIGIKKAKGEIIISVDSDVVLAKDTLPQVVDRIKQDSAIGLLSVKTLDKKTKKPLPYPPSINFFTGTLSSFDPGKEILNPTYVAGVFHAFPQKIVKKIGLYNKNFFFYGDDLDFSIRIKQAGFKVVYFPQSFIYHGKSKDSADIPFSIKYHHYYKALFCNIYRYGNLIHRISVTFFQLLFIPIFLFVTGKNTLLSARFWGWWWNVKNLLINIKIFLAILILGTTLRILALPKRDFWFDEAFTYHLARLPLKDLFLAVLSDNNPPFYYLLIHFILKLGSSEVWLRLPSLIFSLATIFLIYQASKTHINQKVGLIAASLFALSPLSIYLATESRLHSLATMIVLLLVGSFLALIKHPTKKTGFIFILFAILGLYTQYYIALLFLPFTWIAFKAKTFKPKAWFLILGLCFLPLLPWVILSLHSTHNGCSCPNTLLSLPAALVSPALGGVGEVTLRTFPQLPLPTLILFSTIAGLTFLLFIKGLFQNRLLSQIYLIPLVLLSAFGLFLPVFSPKAFAVFSPIYFVIVAMGIRKLQSPTFFAKLLFLLLFIVSLIQITNPFFKGGNLKPIFNIISNDTELVVAHSSLSTFYSLNYYSRGQQKHILITENPLSPNTLEFIGGKRQDIDSRYSSIWLIDIGKWVDITERELILNKVFGQFKIEKEYQVDNTLVYYLKRK